jgi:hypothetical protein
MGSSVSSANRPMALGPKRRSLRAQPQPSRQASRLMERGCCLSALQKTPASTSGCSQRPGRQVAPRLSLARSLKRRSGKETANSHPMAVGWPTRPTSPGRRECSRRRSPVQAARRQRDLEVVTVTVEASGGGKGGGKGKQRARGSALPTGMLQGQARKPRVGRRPPPGGASCRDGRGSVRGANPPRSSDDRPFVKAAPLGPDLYLSTTPDPRTSRSSGSQWP